MAPDRVVSSLDVAENFVASNRGLEWASMPGNKIWELGREIRRLASSYTPPPVNRAEFPIYVGGWPSANCWAASEGPILTSSLLFSGQVVAKDPLIDWFSLDYYQYRKVMASRRGYLSDEGFPDIRSTREFLAAIMPQFLRLKPLVDSGALVLVPGARTIVQMGNQIEELTRMLGGVPELDPIEIASAFRPQQLATDDRVKGSFVLAGGEREIQISKHVRYALIQFAREYAIAQKYNVTYTAPWPFEQHICEKGLSSPATLRESERVVQAIWASHLPLFHNIQPSTLAKVREHDEFAEFRGELFDAYRGLSTTVSGDEFAREVAEVENVKLDPIIRRAEKSAASGRLARIGVEVASFAAQMSASFVVDGMKDEITAATAVQGGLAYLLGRIFGPKSSQGAVPIFAQLSKHSRSTLSDIRGSEFQEAIGNVPGLGPSPFQRTPESNGWQIAPEPFEGIYVSAGELIAEHARLPGDSAIAKGGPAARNVSCACCSGIKWKNCCNRVPLNACLGSAGRST